MATIIDVLRIIVEADARGLDRTLKKILETAVGTVNAINKQEVDWTSIFTRSVTPAIIESVASMLAFAIEQSLQFQQAMNQTGTAAGDSAQQVAQLGQQALGLSRTVPSSAQDIANSMTQVSAVFGTNTKATNDITEALSQLSASGFGSLTDITQTAMELFRQFGVTTEEQATQVLTDLMHAAEGAKESIPDLAKQFSSFSGQLPQADRNLSSFNGLISTFAAEVANIGPDAAAQIFQALASSAGNAAGPMEILGVSFTKIQSALKTGDIVSVIGQASEKMKALGPNAMLVAQGFGFSAQQVSAFQNNSTKLPKIASDAKDIADKTQTIRQAFDQSDSALRELMVDWNKFSALFTSGLIAQSITLIAKALGKVLDAEQWILDHAGDIFGAVMNPFSAVTKVVEALPNLFSNIFSGNNISSIFGKITDSVQSLLGLQSGKLNSTLQGTGVGFSQGALDRIDKTADQSGLIDSLTSALQTGIKSGQYSTLVNTFHLNVPNGSQGLTAKMIASQLYSQFQGTQ